MYFVIFNWNSFWKYFIQHCWWSATS